MTAPQLVFGAVGIDHDLSSGLAMFAFYSTSPVPE